MGVSLMMSNWILIRLHSLILIMYVSFRMYASFPMYLSVIHVSLLKNIMFQHFYHSESLLDNIFKFFMIMSLCNTDRTPLPLKRSKEKHQKEYTGPKSSMHCLKDTKYNISITIMRCVFFWFCIEKKTEILSYIFIILSRISFQKKFPQAQL